MRPNTMSGFILILTPGIVLADGPAKKRADAEVSVASLEMHGRWEGTFKFVGIQWKAEIEGGKLRCYEKGKLIATHEWRVLDEGEGKIRLLGCPGKTGRGIYKVERDRVTICFSDEPKPRPKEFRVTKDQAIYILQRVKPCK